MRIFSKYSRINKNRHDAIPDNPEQSISHSPVQPSLTKNIAILESLFSDTSDLTVRFLEIKNLSRQAALVYLEGLSDKDMINNHILRPLIQISDEASAEIPVSIGQVRKENNWGRLEEAILEGRSVLLIDQREEAYILGTQGWPQRAVSTPHVEHSIKGAQQALVETSIQNIALIRRYIQNRELKNKIVQVGTRSKTKISILYLEDLANPDLLETLLGRIQKINVDGILNSGELAEWIEDNPHSPFPQFLITERPDIAAAHILQSRFVIVVDGSPNVIIAPASFTMFFSSMDDYGSNWVVESFIRLQRYFGFFIALLLPAFYIAVISFNYEIIPLKLLLSVGESRGRVPFPSLIEALIMEFAIEMMREAGIRLPSPIGQTIGVVGGIIIGQAAVQAGIVSNIMVIIVALTAIASFILPSYEMASGIRLVRFPMMLLASQFGVFGIMIGLLILIAHFISLESLGTPFGSPVAPIHFADLKDSFIRFPMWKIMKIPTNTRALQSDRRKHKDDTK
ncbi:spore germination protein [Cohnella sp.]|uniref:spore germination protein n=1 Tax=Cohnella sp. TaxID=1883426 RepID=UPI0035637278